MAQPYWSQVGLRAPPHTRGVAGSIPAAPTRKSLLRARSHPVFLVSDALFRDLENPPVVTDRMLMDAFGRIPGTQNPPGVAREQALRLLELAGVEFAT